MPAAGQEVPHPVHRVATEATSNLLRWLVLDPSVRSVVASRKQETKSPPSTLPICSLQMEDGMERVKQGPPHTSEWPPYSSVDMGWPWQWGEPGDCYEERGKKPVLTVLHSKELHVKAAFVNHGPQTSSISFTWEIVRNQILRPRLRPLHQSLRGKGPASCVLTRSFSCQRKFEKRCLQAAWKSFYLLLSSSATYWASSSDAESLIQTLGNFLLFFCT